MKMSFKNEEWLRANITSISADAIDATVTKTLTRGRRNSLNEVIDKISADMPNNDPERKYRIKLDSLANPPEKSVLDADWAYKPKGCQLEAVIVEQYMGNRNKKVGKGAENQTDADERYARRRESARYSVVLEDYEYPKGVANHSNYPIKRLSCRGVHMQRYTNEEWFRLLQMAVDGKSLGEMAEALGRSKGSVRRKLYFMRDKELCPDISFIEQKKWTPKETNILKKRKRGGVKEADIAKELGRSFNSVHGKVRDLRRKGQL